MLYASADLASSPPVTTAPEKPASDETDAMVKASPWILSTYFAEGLPYSIVHQISAEFFTAMGASLTMIGLTSLYGIPWNLKFIWSPLVGRYGTTRRWIIGVEVALGLLVIAVAWPATTGDLEAVARMLMAVSFLAATQDIAIDGFYLQALDKKAQAAFSGVRVAAYRVAVLVGKGALVALAGVTSWFYCFAGAGVILLVSAGFHAITLPRPSPVAAPLTSGWRAFIEAFASFFRQPGIALSLPFILTFRAGDAMMFAMGTPLLKHLGLDTTARGVLSGVVGTIASIAGSIVGGALIARFTLKRTLFPIALTQGLAILLYVWLAWARPSLVATGVAVAAEQFVAGVGTSAFAVFLMRRCSGEHKVAHFAVASALMSVATTASGSVSGVIAEEVGFTVFFAFAFLLATPGIALSRVVPSE